MLIDLDIGHHSVWRHHSGVVVYPFSIVQELADIGENTHIGSHCFIEAGAVVGKNVTIKNGCMIWAGVTIEDDCFIGPGVIFTNDARPQSPRAFPERYANKSWRLPTVIGKASSIGAGCLIAPGLIVRANSKIPMGTIVKEDWWKE